MFDETDIRIIRKMQANSRISFKKLAEELGLSVDTVIRRYRKLKENGKVKAAITINAAKTLNTEADWFFVSLKPESNMAKIIAKLSKINGVTSIHSAIGNYDILVETLNPSFARGREIEKTILEMPEVYRVVTRIYHIPVPEAPIPLSRPWLESWLMVSTLQDMKE
jgi:Lrp/AsnC family transcriptional regulator for asnA, asnC and gidA